MATAIKAKEEASKALEKVKPSEQRLAAWNPLLKGMFEWEQKNLTELNDYSLGDFDKDKFTEKDLVLLKPLEDEINRVKKLKTSSLTARKDFTNPINNFIDRLMTTEKGWAEIQTVLEGKFMSLKRVEKDIVDKQKQKEARLQSFRTRLQQYLNHFLRQWKEYIIAICNEKYQEAIDNVNPEELLDWLKPIFDEHPVDGFTVTQFDMSKEELNDEDVQKIYKELMATWDKKSLHDEFLNSMNDKFNTFEFDKMNAEEAKEEAENQKKLLLDEAKEKEITDNAMAEIDAKVNLDLAPTTIGSPTKSIKTYFVVEMENTLNNMLIIEKAFYANKNECLSLYQGKDVWKIDAYKKAELLAKMKDKDPKFECEGVIFVEKEKV